MHWFFVVESVVLSFICVTLPLSASLWRLVSGVTGACIIIGFMLKVYDLRVKTTEMLLHVVFY